MMLLRLPETALHRTARATAHTHVARGLLTSRNPTRTAPSTLASARALATHADPANSAKKPCKRRTPAEVRAEEEEAWQKVHPEVVVLAKHYLSYAPPWVIPPPPLSFNPGIDLRSLGRPKTEQDKLERSLCKEWRKKEGKARAAKLREEVAKWREKRSKEDMEKIVDLAMRIGELRAQTELGWLALEADMADEELTSDDV